MKQKLIIVLMIISFKVDVMFSERLFETIAPLDMRITIQNWIHVFDTLSIGSINYELSNSIMEYNNNYSRCLNPYRILNFLYLNEKQIDTIIHKLNNKEYIFELYFYRCPIKKLPDSLILFQNLYGIHLNECDSITSFGNFNSVFSIFNLWFENCRIKKLPKGIERLKSMLKLILEFPDDFNEFNLNNALEQFTKRNNIIDLFVKYKSLEIFPENLFNLTSLQTIVFLSESCKYIPDKFDKLINLISLIIVSNNEKEIETIKSNENLNFVKEINYSEELKKHNINEIEFFSQKKILNYQKK